jgi:hypothetical protein
MKNVYEVLRQKELEMLRLQGLHVPIDRSKAEAALTSSAKRQRVTRTQSVWAPQARRHQFPLPPDSHHAQRE